MGSTVIDDIVSQEQKLDELLPSVNTYLGQEHRYHTIVFLSILHDHLNL